MHWIMLPLKRYFEFSGRSRRQEYWMFALFWFLASGIASFVDMLLGFGATTQVVTDGVARVSYESTGSIAGIVALLLLVPGFTVSARRLHDTDRSAWWLLLLLLPILGWIVLFVFYCTDGTPGDNRFGRDPKQEDLAEVFR